jgi:hypothetical protein
MVLLSNRLDIIAWLIFINSGVNASSDYGVFHASKWSNYIIEQLTNALLEDRFDLHNRDIDRWNFYVKLKKRMDSNDDHSISNMVSEYIKGFNSSKYFPIEIEIAKHIYINHGCTCLSELQENAFSFKYTETEFLKSCIDKSVLDELLRECICMDNSIYAAISGDGDYDRINEISSEISIFGDIVCTRIVDVTEAGKKQWVRLQYAHESHWDERNMSTYMNHPMHGYRISGSSVGIIFFRKKNAHYNIRDIKKNIRGLLNAKLDEDKIYPHVHFPDTHLEVKWIANAALNKNSQEWMNRSQDIYPNKFSILIGEYSQEMSIRSDETNFCVDTGGVISLHGIRDTRDIDYISLGDSEKPIVNSMMGSHNSQYKGYSKSIQEIIENPNFYFFYKNIKFITLKEVLSFKKYRYEISKNKNSKNSEKDKKDIILIEKYLDSNLKTKELLDKKEKRNHNAINNCNKDNIGLLRTMITHIKPKVLRSIKNFLKKILPIKLIRIFVTLYVFIKTRDKRKIRKRIPNVLG